MKKLLLNFLLNAMISKENVLANIGDDVIIPVKIKSYNDNGQIYVSYHIDGDKFKTGYLDIQSFNIIENVVHFLPDTFIKKINKQGILKRIGDDGDIFLFKVTNKAKGKLLHHTTEVQMVFDIDSTTKEINGKIKLVNPTSAIEIISITEKTYNKFIKTVLKVVEHANSINAENMVVSSKDFLKST